MGPNEPTQSVEMSIPTIADFSKQHKSKRNTTNETQPSRFVRAAPVQIPDMVLPARLQVASPDYIRITLSH
jgi:hypothetical protein